MIGKTRVNVSKGLLHINMFIEMAIKKRIFDFKLAKRPFVGHIKRVDNTDCSGLDDRAKSVSVVKTKYLCVALVNKKGFEMFNRSVGQIFGLKHPFGTHNVGVGGSRNQNPDTIVLQGLNFFIHSSEPSKILSNRFESFRLDGCKKNGKKSKGTHESEMCWVALFEDAGFGSCEYRMRTQGSDCNGRAINHR